MRISDWSSDVCSSDLHAGRIAADAGHIVRQHGLHDQALDRADEQGGRGFRIEVRMQFAPCLSGVSDGIQPTAVRIGEPMPATDTSPGSSAAAQLAALVEETTSPQGPPKAMPPPPPPPRNCVA